MDFWRAVGILNNRKWLIILSVIAATTLTWGATRLVGAKWVAEVKFTAISSSPLAVVQAKGGESDSLMPDKGSMRDRDRAQLAQIDALLRSPAVVSEALNKLNKVQFPSDLLDRVEVSMAGPGVYAMRYTDSSQNRAMVIANALSEAFVDRFHSLFTERAKKNVDLLQAQLTQAQARLDESNRRYAAFQSSRRLTGANLGNDAEAANRRVVEATQKRDELRQRLAEAQAQLSAKERQLVAVPKTIVKKGTLIPSPILPKLREEQMEKQKAYDALAARYTPEHPGVKKAKAELDDVNRQVENEKKNAIRNPDETVTNPAYEIINRELWTLKGTVGGYQAQIPAAESALSAALADKAKFSNVTLPVSALANEVQQNTEIRNQLQARVHAAQLQLDAAQAQQPLAIADPVSNEFNPPLSATKGRTLKLLILAFLGALIGTCAIVVALDSVDRRMKTVGQAEMALPARVIAAIPQPMGNVSYANLARATQLQPSSLHSEAYRFLGLHLLSPRGPKVRSLMVLSAKAEQGSTTTVTNLAITLAQAGKKVILVDANVRTAELHQVFETSNEVGFTDLLRDPSPENIDKCMRPCGVANLHIITSGPMTDNAWQLFRSDNLIELSRRLHERADFVLYDTPSALIFTDALNLAPVVDAAFLCVRAMEALTGAEQRVVELLEQSNVTVLGSVLSDVPTAVVEGYHNYQHYYGGAIASTPSIAGRTDGGSSMPLIEMPRSEQSGGRKNGAG